ncbi:DUF2917 domain-containing protein [Roseateles sp.]|uniref:DUF2917 domain-containing protein n=1 Tax=Roseateles sp. TaxID=1971397 RepID=UPI004037064E
MDVEFAKPYLITTPAAVWVMCLSGRAWLTRDGCRADLVLSPGDMTKVSRADVALVTGMPCCRLGIGEKREQLTELQGLSMDVTSDRATSAGFSGPGIHRQLLDV